MILVSFTLNVSGFFKAFINYFLATSSRWRRRIHHRTRKVVYIASNYEEITRFCNNPNIPGFNSILRRNGETRLNASPSRATLFLVLISGIAAVSCASIFIKFAQNSGATSTCHCCLSPDISLDGFGSHRSHPVSPRTKQAAQTRMVVGAPFRRVSWLCILPFG